MRRSVIVLSGLALVVALGCAMPAAAQDVLPKSGGTQSPPSLLDLFTPKSAPKKDDTKPDQENVTPKNPATPLPGAKTGVTPYLPPKAYVPPTQTTRDPEGSSNDTLSPAQRGSKTVEDLMDKITRQPTRVFQQPDTNSQKDDRTFKNSVTVKAGTIVFNDEDLQKMAAGTELKPENVLQSCEQRLSGSIGDGGPEGGGESFEGRGTTPAKSGYKVSLASADVVLSLACKLAAPPINRGMVPKFGDYYIFGVAMGGCAPSKPIKSGSATVTADYADGNLTCTIN